MFEAFLLLSTGRLEGLMMLQYVLCCLYVCVPLSSASQTCEEYVCNMLAYIFESHKANTILSQIMSMTGHYHMTPNAVCRLRSCRASLPFMLFTGIESFNG